MNSEIEIFKSELWEVRTEIINGEVHFCANDVLATLGYKHGNWRTTLSRMCKYAVKSNVLNYRGRYMNMIPESDVYRLVMSSKLPGAIKFQDWITDEVLPTIRETGGYIPHKEEDSDENIMAKTLAIAQRTIEKKCIVVK